MQTNQTTQKADAGQNSSIITCGKHELAGKNVGETVTVTEYRNAAVGSGMDAGRKIVGKLAEIVTPLVRRAGCSFAWSEVRIVLS